MAFFSQSFSTRFRGRAGTVAGAGARQRPLEDEKPKEKELMQMQMQMQMHGSLARSIIDMHLYFFPSVCLPVIFDCYALVRAAGARALLLLDFASCTEAANLQQRSS